MHYKTSLTIIRLDLMSYCKMDGRHKTTDTLKKTRLEAPKCAQPLSVRSNFSLEVFLCSNSWQTFTHILCHCHGKSAFLLQISFFCCFSIFLLLFQNAQNTQNVNEKARILVDNPWKVKRNIFLFFKCRGRLTILSNICNKSFGKIVNGV